MNMQTGLNGYFTRSIARVSDHLQQRDALNFEVLNNLVVELTRVSIENRNMKMRVESLNTRLDFAERRARALEGVVQYKQGASPVSLTTLEPVADRASPQTTPTRRAVADAAGVAVAAAQAARAARVARPVAGQEGGADFGRVPTRRPKARRDPRPAGDGGADPAES